MRWGILGAARINRSIIPALRAAEGHTLEAIAGVPVRDFPVGDLPPETRSAPDREEAWWTTQPLHL
jgi:hypothetical protein